MTAREQLAIQVALPRPQQMHRYRSYELGLKEIEIPGMIMDRGIVLKFKSRDPNQFGELLGYVNSTEICGAPPRHLFVVSVMVEPISMLDGDDPDGYPVTMEVIDSPSPLVRGFEEADFNPAFDGMTTSV